MNTCFLTRIFDKKNQGLRALSFVDQNRSVSYGELRERTESLRSFLSTQNLSPGDRVLVAQIEEDELAVNFLALVSLGAVMVPVNPALTGHELTQIFKQAPIRYLLAGHSFIVEHAEALIQSAHLETIFTSHDPTGELPEGLTYSHPPKEFPSPALPAVAPKKEAIVTCHFTMKGLGFPLGVEHSYEDYCRSIDSCQEIFKFRSKRRLLTLLPCYPVFGLVTNLLYPLAFGCELVIQDKRIGDVVRAIEKFSIDHVNLVPAVMEKMLLEVRKRSELTDLSRVCFVAGGSFVSADLHRRFQESFNSAPVQGYGLTETLPILTNRPEAAKPGTLGTLMRSEVEVKILDRRGQEVPPGKAGEICISGPGVISRYLNHDDPEGQLFRGTWLRTGDLAYLDDEGHVVFLGRRLDFTKVLGNMVDFREIEAVALSVTGVKNARSYVTETQGREKLCLALVVTKDFSGTKKDIIDICRTRLSPYKVPSVVKIFKHSYSEVAP